VTFGGVYLATRSSSKKDTAKTEKSIVQNTADPEEQKFIEYSVCLDDGC